MEPYQVGVATAIHRLDETFVNRISGLTDTKPHIFLGERLTNGDIPEYQQLSPEVLEYFSTREGQASKDDILFNEITIHDTSYFQGILPLYTENAYVGAIAALYSKEIARAHTLQIIKILSGILFVSIVVLVPVVTLFSNSFTKPLQQIITDLTKGIAEGDFSKDIVVRQTDEIGDLAAAFRKMKSTISAVLEEMNTLIQAVQEGKLDTRGDAEAFKGSWCDLIIGANTVIDAFVAPINVTAEFIARLSKGDIPEEITEEYKGDFNELMRALNAMIQRLSEVVSNVKMVANHVATSSEQMTSSSANMSQGAAHQASAMEEASSSMQQMAANIRQNADNARETEKIALQAAQYAEEGGKVVAETVVAMQQIAEKIAIIEDIAMQTRMLSLNATIEAARAQEHGKAFSVVASEVRQLSDITKKAAEEISKLATSSLDVSEKAGEMLTTLVPSIHKTAELVQEISAASSEQSTGTEQINTAIQQLDQVTQQNAATSDELASMAETLAHQVAQLLETIAFFEVGRTAETTMQEAKKTREKRLTEAGPNVRRHEELKEGAEDRETGDGKPAGYGLEMIPDEDYGDERDAEFERY
jgi:methyl-accepting chemotaxis protein